MAWPALPYIDARVIVVRWPQTKTARFGVVVLVTVLPVMTLSLPRASIPVPLAVVASLVPSGRRPTRLEATVAPDATAIADVVPMTVFLLMIGGVAVLGADAGPGVGADEVVGDRHVVAEGDDAAGGVRHAETADTVPGHLGAVGTSGDGHPDALVAGDGVAGDDDVVGARC